MPSICSQLTQLYQTWSDSHLLMREARLRYQESGTTKDKQTFDEGLARTKTSQREYNHEAYETLVEYRDLQICQLEALVIQGIDSRLALGGGKEPELEIESGRVVKVYLNYNKGSTIDSVLKLIPHLRSLTRLDCDRTSITELPKLPDPLTWLNCCHTSITELPKLPASLTRLYCSHTFITELPELPDSLSFINIQNTPAAKDPEVQKKLKTFQEVHPGTTVHF